MAVPPRVDGVGLSQQALLDLERSKIPPVELLDEVVQILGVSYSHIRSTLFSPDQGHETIPPIAYGSPKEEWILRWLLKRTGLWSIGGKVKISTYDSLRMRQDDRSWLLFLFLVYHIPCQALARILIEADFATNLNACLSEGVLGPVSANGDGLESAMSIQEPKAKKRKRELSGHVKGQKHDRPPSADLFATLRTPVLCAVIKHLVDLSTLVTDQISCEHIIVALATPPGIAASVAGRLLSDIVLMLSQETPAPFNRGVLVNCVSGLLGLWEHRIGEDVRPSESTSDQEFTNHCLAPCLAFLQLLKTADTSTRYDRTAEQLERLIALHSILPARAEFISTRNEPTHSQATDEVPRSPILDVLSRISNKHSPLLYDIAVRTIPLTTLRRRQSEQLWLEALFSKLATSCGDEGLQDLLQVAITHQITLPQKELSQIAFRQFSDAKIQWLVLVKVLQVDASVFFLKSVPLMERLCDSIVDSADEDYTLIRDSIVIPLARVAAQSRELQDYVQIWHRRLSEDIQDKDKLGSRGSRVWQDPDLFAAFSEIVRTNASPFFVHNMVRKSLEQITRSSEEDDDAMSRALAWATILGSVITVRAKDCLAEAGALRQLLEATAALITHPKCPHSQRWHLWRLVRQILTILPEEDADDVLPLNSGELSLGTSLEDWNRDGDTLELTECFHLLVCRASAKPAKYGQMLQEEFKHLANFLNAISPPSANPSPFGLADICLAIILQNSEVLLLRQIDNLWPALWRYASSSRSARGQRLFMALVLSDTVTSNRTLLSQCFQVIQDAVAGQEHHRSEFARNILLSMPCQNIKRSHERTKLVNMLEDAGIGKVAEELDTAPSSMSAETPLFNEFKARISSSNTTSHPERHLPLLKADSFERLCLELDYAKLTLNTPNQFAVDDLLSALALLTSPRSPTPSTMPHDGPSAIYRRLCSLTGTLITRFRKRLGGRYHLLLPVLQGLLRCLFRPIPIPTSSKQPQIRHHQPPWLLDPATEPLTPKSATQYTRLLTSLCNPTTSSVKHSHRTSAALTDYTKKARSIAGQYMQYLVVEYARCQLQGQLRPEVKAALMPGLYAVLDVMSREVMRGMNAAMDSSSRAIFKGLYEDYQRFGRWNEN